MQNLEFSKLMKMLYLDSEGKKLVCTDSGNDLSMNRLKVILVCDIWEVRYGSDVTVNQIILKISLILQLVQVKQEHKCKTS